MKIRKKLENNSVELSKIMGIIVGLGSAAYKMEDGIFVVPIGCLRDWNVQLSQRRLFIYLSAMFCT